MIFAYITGARGIKFGSLKTIGQQNIGVAANGAICLRAHLRAPQNLSDVIMNNTPAHLRNRRL